MPDATRDRPPTESVTLTARQWHVVRMLLYRKRITQAQSQLSEAQWNELMHMLSPFPGLPYLPIV